MRDQFPILSTQVNGQSLIYYDNAATLQMPQPVLEKIQAHYYTCNGNVHRGNHTLATCSEQNMEHARETVARFLGAARPEEIVFTSGTTQGINLLARLYEDQLLKAGDEIIVTALEHHSNFLPWLEVCRRTGAVLRIAPITPEGDLDLEAYGRLLGSRTRLVCATWVSNAIGTVNPVEQMVQMAHGAGAKVLIDAAQAVLHRPIQVGRLGCDYLVFSGHKLGALTGIGVLYGKEELLDAFYPPAFGGGMISRLEGLTPRYSPVPTRFEAGTPNYVGAISLGAAIEFLNQWGIPELAACTEATLQALRPVILAHGGNILGNPKEHAGVLSVTFPGVHPFDLASLLDQYGVAVRAGHHCASYALRQFGVAETLRISPAFYNELWEIDPFERAIDRALRLLKELP